MKIFTNPNPIQSIFEILSKKLPHFICNAPKCFKSNLNGRCHKVDSPSSNDGFFYLYHLFSKFASTSENGPCTEKTIYIVFSYYPLCSQELIHMNDTNHMNFISTNLKVWFWISQIIFRRDYVWTRAQIQALFDVSNNRECVILRNNLKKQPNYFKLYATANLCLKNKFLSFLFCSFEMLHKVWPLSYLYANIIIIIFFSMKNSHKKIMWIGLMICVLNYSEIYCSGDVLHTIQMAHIFNDSKTFVDMKLKRPPNETVQLFHEFMNQHGDNPSKEDIIQFVSVSIPVNFLFTQKKIRRNSTRVKIQCDFLWKKKCRQISKNGEQNSMIGCHPIGPNHPSTWAT